MQISRRALLALPSAVLLGACTPERPARANGASAITNIRIFDGRDLLDSDTVLIDAPKITAVGRGLSIPAGTPIYDGKAGTLLPGLIDAHTHVGAARGSLRDALRYGVTTMVDMFGDHHALGGYKTARDSVTNTTAADVWGAGVLATVPGGHGTQYGMGIPTIDAGTDLVRFVADRIAEGSDFLKIVIEEGWPGTPRPTLRPKQVEGLVNAAHQAGVKAAVHVHSVAAALTAVTSGADILAHVPRDRHLTDQLVAALINRKTAVIATLAVIGAHDCGARESAALHADPMIKQWLSLDQIGLLDATNDGCLDNTLEIAQANIATAYRAGVPILAGTDIGNTGTAAGASMHEELTLLTRSGLSPAAALTAATSNPATVFNLTARGRIASGHRADLLLLHGDPLADISATRNIAAVWKNGHIIDRTPQ